MVINHTILSKRDVAPFAVLILETACIKYFFVIFKVFDAYLFKPFNICQNSGFLSVITLTP